jgi:hypothetical protein
MATREEKDEATVTVSATSTIVCIFFLLSIGALLATFYLISHCMGDSKPDDLNTGWAPDQQHTTTN